MAPRKYICAFCSSHTGPHMGYFAQPPGRYVFICTFCSRPTYFEGGSQFPSPPMGDDVGGLPDQVRAAYEECRASASAGAFTAATLMLRTLISHVAVEKGATAGESFNQHVQHLGLLHRSRRGDTIADEPLTTPALAFSSRSAYVLKMNNSGWPS